MSVYFVLYTPCDGAAWSLLVGCIAANNTAVDLAHALCYLDLDSLFNCAVHNYVCRFCGLYILFHILWPVCSVYSVARSCSVLNHIQMMVMYLHATCNDSARSIRLDTS